MHKIEKAISIAIGSRANNALITETFDLAREQASQALRNGLTPFPIVVKDCFAVERVPLTCGSKSLETMISPYSATVLRKLVSRGGCIIGKANLDEFCMGTSSARGFFGPVKSGFSEESNLATDWRIPGGSSGGSAVAVHLGIADVALGSDTGGSSRNPAAFNGIFGLKPTYGVCSRFGLIPLVNTLDAPSVMARTAEDCLNALDVIAGVDEKDATSLDLPPSRRAHSLEGITVAIPKEYHNEDLSEDAWRVWNRAANVSLPSSLYSLICYQVLAAAEVASNMARYDGISVGGRAEDCASSTFSLLAASRSEHFGKVVRRRILAGNYFTKNVNRGGLYEQAQKMRRLISDELSAVLLQADCLLTPTATGSAPLFSHLQHGRFHREDADDFYTQCVNLAGLPAVSVPFGEGEGGLPIGVQLVGRAFDDRFMLDIARLLHLHK